MRDQVSRAVIQSSPASESNLDAMAALVRLWFEEEAVLAERDDSRLIREEQAARSNEGRVGPEHVKYPFD
jgi:hypothetical protein